MLALSQPIGRKTRISPDFYSFFHARQRLHVFALSSDWFIGLCVSLVIGQNDYFGFSFMYLKTALTCAYAGLKTNFLAY